MIVFVTFSAVWFVTTLVISLVTASQVIRGQGGLDQKDCEEDCSHDDEICLKFIAYIFSFRPH